MKKESVFESYYSYLALGQPALPLATARCQDMGWDIDENHLQLA